jgi:hypothetical protein
MPGFHRGKREIAGLFAAGVILALTAGVDAACAWDRGPACEAPGTGIVYGGEHVDRTLAFTYAVEIPAQPAGVGPIDVFIPLSPSRFRSSTGFGAGCSNHMVWRPPGRNTVSKSGNK